jgi:hypothetical protein
MSRPLTANLKRNSEANDFHRRVFAKYGVLCWFGKRLGHPKKRAIDAAHILGRGTRLGPLRYVDVRLARPLCRECHDRQGAHDPKYQFDYADYKDAVLAHNAIAKQQIELVDRKTYMGRAS